MVTTVVFPLKPTGRSFKRNDLLHTEERPVPFKETGSSLKSIRQSYKLYSEFSKLNTLQYVYICNNK